MCAVGFGFVPGLERNLGESALTAVSWGLGLLLLGGIVLLRRAGRPIEWRIAADAISLLVLVPVLVMASSIEVADARLGGRSLNLLAAAVATLLVYLIVVTVATRAGADRTPASQIGALPGALAILIILLGTEYFAAGAAWRGLSIAWMVAAVASVVSTFVSVHARAIVAPVALALVAIGLLVPDFLGESERSLSAQSSGIAVIVSALAALVLILVPHRGRVRPVLPPPERPNV